MSEATEDTSVPIYEIQPEDVKNYVAYQQLQFSRDQQGNVQIGIIQVPVPRVLIEQFIEQFGTEMAHEDVNLKLQIVKGKAYLSPAKTTSLIGFRDA